MAQMVKHLPTKPETRVQSLDWEDLLEKEMATHSSILAWKIPWTEEPTVHGVAKSQTQLSNFTSLHIHPKLPNNPFTPSFPPGNPKFPKSVSLFLFCKFICIISFLFL